VIRTIFLAAILVLPLGGAAVSASHSAPTPPTPQPTEVKIISVPPAQPSEVKIVSVPVVQPTEVRVLSVPPAPPDESAHSLVTVTWVLVFANIGLCALTWWGARKQSADQRMRDRRAMVREINRAAHKIMVTAERTKELASEVPTVRNHLHTVIGQGGMPGEVRARTEEALRIRKEILARMIDEAGVNAVVFSDLEALSDKELAERLWKLDEFEQRLVALRDQIEHELKTDKAESDMLRQQNIALKAAALNADLMPQV
jgi:hypothetical protein